MAPEPIQMKDTINGHPRPPWVKYNKEWHNLHAQRRKGIEEACLIEATGTAQNPMCDVCAKIFQHDQTVQCKSITGDGVVKCSRCANRHARCAFVSRTRGFTLHYSNTTCRNKVLLWIRAVLEQDLQNLL
jgi:hypothetical protein